MPLTISKQINENLLLAVWEITESFSELEGKILLSPSDQELLEAGSHKQKKIEFLAGRNLVKKACSEFGIEHSPIYRNGYGKPVLPQSNWDVSLSHTDELIVCLLGKERKVGIDIERPNEKIRKISHRLFRDSEIKDCTGDIKKLTKLWSAKEVLYKIYMKRGLDFKENIFVYPLDDEWNKAQGKVEKGAYCETFELCFEQLEEYIMCYNQ